MGETPELQKAGEASRGEIRFGPDEVAPASQSNYLRVFERYAPLWKLLSPSTGERKTNYARTFDEVRHRVRRWRVHEQRQSVRTDVLSAL